MRLEIKWLHKLFDNEVWSAYIIQTPILLKMLALDDDNPDLAEQVQYDTAIALRDCVPTQDINPDEAQFLEPQWFEIYYEQHELN